MVEKLREAMQKQGLVGNPLFRQVVLVDDFYGSGTSLLHYKDGTWRGKLLRPYENLEKLREDGVLEQDANVIIVLYIASHQAEGHIRAELDNFQLSWQLHVVQRLPADIVTQDAELIELCHWFFDEALIDEHKKGPIPLGYGDAALPLVIYHNTPNNSISLLWADSVAREGSKERRALFPRYERHHVDRP
jgi:hypothetical protein